MKPDELTSRRLSVLSSLVSSSPAGKLGRTAVVKLLYFLQELHEVPLGYDFRLYTFGPYDAEVLNDLATAKLLNALTEKPVLYATGYGYAINPGSNADAVRNRVTEWLKLHQQALG